MIIKTEYTVGVPLEILQYILRDRALANNLINEENGEISIEGLTLDIEKGYIMVDSIVTTRLDS